MPYIITNRAGDTIIIPDEGLNQDYSVDLVGRNYPNYGSVVASSFVDLLNNFATDTTPPAKATSGQLWYDKTFKKIRVYDSSTGSWLPLGPIVSSSVPGNNFSQNKAGTSYFNTTTSQHFIHDGSTYREANVPGIVDRTSAYSGASIGGTPGAYGSRLRSIFLADSDGVKRTVLALVYTNDVENVSVDYYNGEKIVAIISGHETFTVGDENSDLGAGITHNYYNELTATTGIGATIRSGINLRADNESVVSQANRSFRADAAYNLNVGSYGADGANISASAVYHSGASMIPAVTNTYDVGSSTYIFNDGHFKDLHLGSTTGSITKASGANVVIGASGSSINQIYVEDLTVDGTIVTTGGDVDMSTSNVSANELTANVVNINGYTLPVSAGSTNDMLVLGSTGNVAFKTQPLRIGSLSSSGSLQIDSSTTTDTDSVNGITTTTNSYTFEIDDAYVHGLFSVSGSGLSYDDTTGEFSLTYSSSFDSFNPADFVQITGSQTVTGLKTFSNKLTLSGGVAMGDADFEYTNNLTFTSLTDPTGSVAFSPNGTVTASGDLVSFSDRKLKDNLVVIENALDKVDALTGYVYNRVDLNRKQTGLLAQDVEAVLPEAVLTSDDGTLGVAYGNMLGLIVQAIKELRAEVKDIKNQLGR